MLLDHTKSSESPRALPGHTRAFQILPDFTVAYLSLPFPTADKPCLSVPQTSKLRMQDSIVESTAAYKSQQQRTRPYNSTPGTTTAYQSRSQLIRAYQTLQGTTATYHSPPQSRRALYDESQPQSLSDAPIVYRNKTLPKRTRPNTAYKSHRSIPRHSADEILPERNGANRSPPEPMATGAYKSVPEIPEPTRAYDSLQEPTRA